MRREQIKKGSSSILHNYVWGTPYHGHLSKLFYANTDLPLILLY
jgi:hypothetical protein